MTNLNHDHPVTDSKARLGEVSGEPSTEGTAKDTTVKDAAVKTDRKSENRPPATEDIKSEAGVAQSEQRPRVSLVVPDATGGSDVPTHKALKHPGRPMPRGLSSLGDEHPHYTRSVTTASGLQRGRKARKDRSKILGRAMTHQVGSNYDRELHWLKPYYPTGKDESDGEEEEGWIPDWVMYFPSMLS
ncbi:hypothetical protein FOZ62_016807, partial [Perkinsus olseni]